MGINKISSSATQAASGVGVKGRQCPDGRQLDGHGGREAAAGEEAEAPSGQRQGGPAGGPWRGQREGPRYVVVLGEMTLMTSLFHGAIYSLSTLW